MTTHPWIIFSLLLAHEILTVELPHRGKTLFLTERTRPLVRFCKQKHDRSAYSLTDYSVFSNGLPVLPSSSDHITVFGPQYDYVLFILQYRSKRPISFRHSIVFGPHYDYVLLVLRYRSKRPISSNHSSLYLAHNTLTFYSPYSIDRSARYLPIIVHCI